MDFPERQKLQAALVRLSQGSRAAFEPVFAALWPLLSSLCTQLLRDRSLGEDAAQGALYKIFSRADELDPERDAVAWAVGIAVWECRTLKKKIARRREESASSKTESAASAAKNPEQLAERKELFDAVQSLWGELRASDAEVLEALLREEPPKLPGATFRKRVQRALERLREAWRARHGI